MRHDPLGTGEDEAVLVYVDKTSTRPKEIFLLEDAHFQGTSHFLTDPQENDRRLALLKGLVYYGHIAEGNNHFQFYADMERYFSRAQRKDPENKRKTVDQWLQSLRSAVVPMPTISLSPPFTRRTLPLQRRLLIKSLSTVCVSFT